MGEADNKCMLCGRNPETVPCYRNTPSLQRTRCERCGVYVYDKDLLPADLQRSPELSRKIQRYLYEVGRDTEVFILQGDDNSPPEWAVRAVSVARLKAMYEDDGSALDKYENTILSIASHTRGFGEGLRWPDDVYAVPVNRDEEAGAIIKALEQEGYIATTRPSSGAPGTFWLTPEGLRYAAELRRQIRRSGSVVFVAACFRPDLTPARDAIERVVKEWGYDPRMVDREPGDKLIDLKIYELIRASRFVVADLTWNRQCVYYEVGFADGLGLHVILTCRKDHMKSTRSDFKKVHFDLDHRPIVKWASQDELERELAKRLRQDFGRGPVVESQTKQG